MTALFQDLLNAHADVLLSGHSHDYESVLPQDNGSHLDTANGITQFVVGTGGAFFTGLGTRHANSAASQNSTFGVLDLTLHSSSYDWRFVPESGKAWTDSGTRSCHVVTPPSNDFAINANPASVSVQPGQAVTSAISTSVTSGSAQSITLSASGQPSTTSVSFNPTTITAGSSSTMTITTSTSTPAGATTVTIVGTGSSATRTVPLTLAISSGTATGPTLAQSAAATETVAATSLTALFPAASGAGHLLVAAVSVYTGTTNHITSVTDSGGNIWTRAGAWSVSGHNSDGELWYTTNAKSASSVMTHTASASVVAMRVLDFSGVATSNALDVAAGASNTSTLPASGSVTPAAPGELLVGMIAGHASAQAITMTTPGATTLAQQTSVAGTTASVIGSYLVPGTAGSISITGRVSTAMYWAAGVVAFRAATG